MYAARMNTVSRQRAIPFRIALYLDIQHQIKKRYNDATKGAFLPLLPRFY